MYNIAIIIPTYNEELFIKDCIDSIMLQSYSFEKMDVMIVDGRSNDRTRDVVNTYCVKYSNIRLLDNPGRIQSIAFNIGVHNSSAPYIIRLDAHVKYDYRYIELCLTHLRQNEQYGNVGGVCHIEPFKNSLVANANAVLNKVKFGIGGASFRVGTVAGEVDSVPFGAFPRSVVEKVGGMREDLARGEDNEYNSRIRKAGYKVFMDPQIVSTYFARPTIKASCKQMFANGKSIGKLLYIDRKAIGLRHLIPFFFLLSIIGSILISLFWNPFLILLCIVLGAYLLVDIFASIDACFKYGWKNIFVLPILFFLVHISYGCGTFVGIIKK